jgi:hypothetical protein
MIAQAIADEVERLLSEGRLSQRQIARATGISRGTVGSIAQGKRKRRRTAESFLDPTRPLGPPHRCGGLVYGRCLLCRVRAWKAEQSAAAATLSSPPAVDCIRISPNA